MPRRCAALAEIPRGLLAIASLPAHVCRIAGARKGNRSPILVIPGFATTDNSKLVFNSYLSWLGYRKYGWELDRNLGAETIGFDNERLTARLDDITAWKANK